MNFLTESSSPLTPRVNNEIPLPVKPTAILGIFHILCGGIFMFYQLYLTNDLLEPPVWCGLVIAVNGIWAICSASAKKTRRVVVSLLLVTILSAGGIIGIAFHYFRFFPRERVPYIMIVMVAEVGCWVGSITMTSMAIEKGSTRCCCVAAVSLLCCCNESAVQPNAVPMVYPGFLGQGMEGQVQDYTTMPMNMQQGIMNPTCQTMYVLQVMPIPAESNDPPQYQEIVTQAMDVDCSPPPPYEYIQQRY